MLYDLLKTKEDYNFVLEFMKNIKYFYKKCSNNNFGIFEDMFSSRITMLDGSIDDDISKQELNRKVTSIDTFSVPTTFIYNNIKIEKIIDAKYEYRYLIKHGTNILVDFYLEKKSNIRIGNNQNDIFERNEFNDDPFDLNVSDGINLICSRNYNKCILLQYGIRKNVIFIVDSKYIDLELSRCVHKVKVKDDEMESLIQCVINMYNSNLVYNDKDGVSKILDEVIFTSDMLSEMRYEPKDRRFGLDYTILTAVSDYTKADIYQFNTKNIRIKSITDKIAILENKGYNTEVYLLPNLDANEITQYLIDATI